MRVKKQKPFGAMKAAKDRREEFYDPARKDNMYGTETAQDWSCGKNTSKTKFISLGKALKCLTMGWPLAQSSCEKSRVLQMACRWVGSGFFFLQKSVGKMVLGRRLGRLDLWDSVRLRTAFHSLERSREEWSTGGGFDGVLSNPFVSAETLKACALKGLHLFGSRR